MSASEQFEQIPLNRVAEVARAICRYLPQFPFVAIYGEMGSGKTTLVKALALELGVATEVSSPTFSLVNEYLDRDRNVVYHFDFYRIQSAEEAFDMGYEEYFFSGAVCLVEWPQVIERLLPTPRLEVHIQTGDNHSRNFLIKTVQ